MTNESDETPAQPFTLAYPDASRVTANQAAADVILTADANRPPVKLDARVKDPLKLREALSALYAVVASDYR
ncbi:MAG TPA: SWIM zinc finger family protein, partial [Gemmataceae bacterium]|nr:SWIM zinc finger family protein [Gemmataceae bacterium]